MPLAWSAPFAGLLLCIAVLPLAAAHWWEHNRNKAIVAAVFGVPVALWAFGTMRHDLGHAVTEYASFLCLLGSLYVVAGGVHVSGDLRASPLVNSAFLAAGAVLANVVGTTGASMLLIRPLLRTNSERRHVVHTVVFFIFMVCNTGGLLTPLADPPLFVGFLRGVPFTWSFGLWKEWLLVNGALLAIYLVLDGNRVLQETPAALRRDRRDLEPLRIHGKRNLLLLLGVVALVLWAPGGVREAGMVALAAVSWFTTPRDVHACNQFGWGPIVEVAVLFAGIFVTMVPTLAYLREHAAGLGVREPMQFFWATGALSSFLDNTPTYVCFLELARGLPGPDEVAGVSHAVLAAISCGAVLMGANTYIGNGPNFMVRAIAEAQGLKMPSFFGYMLWSIAILVPLFFVASLLLF